MQKSKNLSLDLKYLNILYLRTLLNIRFAQSFTANHLLKYNKNIVEKYLF